MARGRAFTSALTLFEAHVTQCGAGNLPERTERLRTAQRSRAL